MKYLILLIPVIAQAALPAFGPSIYGVVYFDNVPYEDAEVEFRDDYYNYYSVYSNQSGDYYFSVPHSGWWLIYCHI